MPTHSSLHAAADPAAPDASAIDSFIARWSGQEGGQERANYQLFLGGLCRALALPEPDPAAATPERNDYVFERVVTRHHDEGDTLGRIDLYRRGAFVLEAKQSRWKGGGKAIGGQSDLFSAESDPPDRGRRGAHRAWDVLMLNAKRQAEEYARALPPSHGWPPFVLVCDVGRCIEVYADFSGQGKNYTHFPDRQGFRIHLEDLREADVRERLRRVWLEPQTLDPARTRSRVTREIAERLATVSKALEARSHPAEGVAQFLMRCLFTMFAASMKLLPEDAFRELLDDCRRDPPSFVPLIADLWRSMNTGAFAASLRGRVLQFNGNLFADSNVLPLEREEIGELYEAAGKDWQDVEPAIFGALLEQALDAGERRRLGAHYTPRAYVERLVVATVIEPLREDWRNVQAAAETHRASGDSKRAAAEVKAFHDKLCTTRVLDPACGTGNFLYVAMELMKKLEGEVLEALLDLGGQEALRGLGSHTIDPHQFLGLEINPRAAAIAELVLWIGYLQSHFRTKGGVPEQPILRTFRNIQVQNAVLTWDGYPQVQFGDGREAYPNARRPTWPDAEFIVGNPPFIGKGALMREALGHDYVEALWRAYPHVNESADYVMYWWDRAAALLAKRNTTLRRFGLVTTNSISQVFNRRVIERYIRDPSPTSLVMAIPDHPWTKATPEAAAVRIAMTVVTAGAHPGVVRDAISEHCLDTDAPEIEFEERRGAINADLTIGADVTSAVALKANEGLSCNGMMLAGGGFVLDETAATHLRARDAILASRVIRPFIKGGDLTRICRTKFVIDFFGMSADEARKCAPSAYAHVLAMVKPEREKNRDRQFREKWWLFGRQRPDIRLGNGDLKRFIATTETAKHRVFRFLDVALVPDHMIIAVSTDDPLVLGVLSSKVHVVWTLAQGGTLEDRPRYTKSACFDSFPFPSPGALLTSKLRGTAEELDAFRKQRQQDHPELTITQMYNVLEKLKADIALNEDEGAIRNKGLVVVLKELHETLDALVFEAYGWPRTLTDEQVLERLVALNHVRAAEERRGHVRWLRPDYQIPRYGRALDRQALDEEGAQVAADLGPVARDAIREAFPQDIVAQTAALFAALAVAPEPLDAGAIAASYRGRGARPKTQALLASLARLGHVTTRDGKHFVLRRAA